MAPLGHRRPYLLPTGMSQLGGPRICLLTPSARQTCLPGCFGSQEDPWRESLSRVRGGIC